ncbi:hypothetical protein RB597_010103 [Gaeumannomyces tritici]
MSSSGRINMPSPAPGAGPEPLAMFRTPVFGLGLSVVIAAVFLGRAFGGKKPASAFPSVEHDRSSYNFLGDAYGMVEKGRRQWPGKPFFIQGENGPLLVIPPGMINDIRAHPALSFIHTVREDFHGGLPGFEAFTLASRDDRLLQNVIIRHLTKYMGTILHSLSEEAAFALHTNFGESTEWREHLIRPAILDVISRVASRVFLGEELCRDEAWLEVTKEYTTAAFMAAMALRQRPAHLRFIYQWFEPLCAELRRHRDRSRAIIGPVLERRRAARREALAQGRPAPVFEDGIDWFEQEAQGRPYDSGMAQQALAATGNHTTSDFTTKFMLTVAQHPDLIREMRDEIVAVLRAEGGFTKAALANLKLLDSVMKETQRLQPIATCVLARIATDDVRLPDGTLIPKGTNLVTDGGWRLSPDVYEDPLEFDGHRFLKWRGTDREQTAHFVSTAPSHTGFGHGVYACPGRFFASNESKVILSHLIMKYDWRLAEGSSADAPILGLFVDANRAAKVLVRKRPVVELDLDSLSM